MKLEPIIWGENDCLLSFRDKVISLKGKMVKNEAKSEHSYTILNAGKIESFNETLPK